MNLDQFRAMLTLGDDTDGRTVLPVPDRAWSGYSADRSWLSSSWPPHRRDRPRR